MMSYKGDLQGLPEEVVEKMLERQEEQGNIRNVGVFEADAAAKQCDGGFNWHDTPEGEQFWGNAIYAGNSEVFFSEYPKGGENNMDRRFPFTLTLKDQSRIYNAACGEWKRRLISEFGRRLYMGASKEKNPTGSVLIDYPFYKEMRAACTNLQHSLFDSTFGKDCPSNIPKKGMLVYVRVKDHIPSLWQMRYYSHYENGKHYCYSNQEVSDGSVTQWDIVSTTNPLSEGETLI